MALNVTSVKANYRPETERRPSAMPRILSICAVVLFAAGFFLPVLGLVLSVIRSIAGDDPRLAKFGTVFTIAGIPLLMLSSHLMDVVDHLRSKEKLKRDGQ
ncbi:MAG: hypothetical protein AB7J13_08640 [Pyrinomonadaceae bacterium]